MQHSKITSDSQFKRIFTQKYEINKSREMGGCGSKENGKKETPKVDKGLAP
jgi:hypothetical protein